MENDIERLRRGICEYAARELAGRERKAGPKGSEEGATGKVKEGALEGAGEAEAAARASGGAGSAVEGIQAQIGRMLADAGITLDNPDRIKEVVSQMGFDPGRLNDPKALMAMAEQMTSHMSPEMKTSLAGMAKAAMANLGATNLPPELERFLDMWSVK